MRWLKKEACGKWIVFYILCGVAIKITYDFGMFSLLNFSHIATSNMSSGVAPIDKTPMFFLSMLISAIFEEAVFRLLPLYLAVTCGLSTKKVIFVAVISSVLFGYLHGNAFNLIFQGIGGLLFSLIFLKCGGLHFHFWKAFSVSTIVHLLFNSIIVLIVLM